VYGYSHSNTFLAALPDSELRGYLFSRSYLYTASSPVRKTPKLVLFKQIAQAGYPDALVIPLTRFQVLSPDEQATYSG
jgi:hypothetical protein